MSNFATGSEAQSAGGGIRTPRGCCAWLREHRVIIITRHGSLVVPTQRTAQQTLMMRLVKIRMIPRTIMRVRKPRRLLDHCIWLALHQRRTHAEGSGCSHSHMLALTLYPSDRMTVHSPKPRAQVRSRPYFSLSSESIMVDKVCCLLSIFVEHH